MKSDSLKPPSSEVQVRDLQEILIDRLQKCLPEILEGESTLSDFFKLPLGCLETIFNSDNTLISEIKLYRSLENQIMQLEKGSNGSRKGSSDEVSSAKDMDAASLIHLLKSIRLHLISVKCLVSDVKLSGNYPDSEIFEAI